jgi:protein-S-isoprenylcysteine O-methyltransferase Ste14
MADGMTWQRLAKRIRVPMGFVVAVVFLALAQPSWKTLGLSLLLVLPGLWLRGYAAGYVKKNEELTTTGPYGYTRNPLYLGSLGIALGFAWASGSWWILLGLAAVFAAIYAPTIQGEETYLRGKFGAAFDAYCAAVPRLLPRLTPGVRGRSGAVAEARSFDPARYRHHREYNAGMGAGAIYVALIIRLVLGGHSFRGVR